MQSDLIHQNRRLSQSNSAWVKQFACNEIDCLIICRGPIRKEVMDVLTEMGGKYGILLSEKDSITYQNALAPELRLMSDPNRIHRVPDYTGASKEERDQRIQQIIQIAKDNSHNSIFAGYGFMAEDESLVRAIEESGLTFIGPCSRTVRQAGLKDEAKRSALAADVSVVPGVDDLTVRTLLAKAEREGGLEAIARAHKLTAPQGSTDAEKAEALLVANYDALIDVITIDDIASQAEIEVAKLFDQQPNNRIRLKAIGGGGGKGQRILVAPKDYAGDHKTQVKDASAKVPELLREVLNEVKATGRGDNKNVLIELNIESTRHQEIQVIGNGDWCLTLGGRDCSLQMHEQKLLEVSTTIESLKQAIDASSDTPSQKKALQSDLTILQRMEDEAIRFGKAVGLDSVSTFECIVDADQHFFMEMNTRIQVEHRVSELCYGLRFENPNDPSDAFVVNSLVEAMAIIAWHKHKLPKPTRIPRMTASVEARLNATDAGLTPHAGGVIEYWSSPIDDEIRDDQGICVKNPDTGAFMKYTLAGAYDSNVALLLTVGDNRLVSFERMAEVLRKMTIDGHDVQTNLEFHYGLVHWFLAQNPYARSTTAFIQPYLTLTGLLFEEAKKLDLDAGFHHLASQSTYPEVFARKHTLITRPLKRLLTNPHLLIGWISKVRREWSVAAGQFTWNTNPFRVLADLYHYLNMDLIENAPALEVIWDHDQVILEQGINFYQDLEDRLGVHRWSEWSQMLSTDKAPKAIDAALWGDIQAAHAGFQAGLELLSVVAKSAFTVGFDELKVNEDLTVTIPDRLKDTELTERARKILVPPPVASANEIVAVSSGMFYAQETPGAANFLDVGTHFEVGDPLYIIEVMKMFNKVYAEFAGTVAEVLIERGDGVTVKQGEPLYRIEPDEIAEEIDDEALVNTRLSHTVEQLRML
ncbi:MAG: biotin carboxylase N-terminal domain-containing protein [Pseudomonadota bacterium]|nr:biotin carboxylase N-terminal domain-containing protein [Pseudomonadota bacterium]